MAYLYMSITPMVSCRIRADINSFSSCSIYGEKVCVLSSRKGSINPSFPLEHLHSNKKTLKHHTRARKLGPEREEDDKDYGTEDGNEEDYGADEGNKEDYRAEKAVLKLYTDIKNRNIDGISQVIGDECQCFSNFLYTYPLLQGKKQVVAFFYWLMMKLGKDLKIVVKPTSKDGMTIGVQWQIEWEKPNIQLGKGFSFHICHIYQGKLLIKNVEMFMEPIFHIEPLRLRTMAFAVSLAERIVTYLRPAGYIRRQTMTLLLLALLLLAAAAFYFTQPRF